jgi:hypothetical protein
MRAITATVTPASPTAMVRLDDYATAVLGGQVVCAGGASFTLQHSFDDPNDLVSPVPLANMFWDNSLLPPAAQGGSANVSFQIMASPLWMRLNLGAVAPTVFNSADEQNVTLTNGGLTATQTAANAFIRSTTAYSAGKYHFEVTVAAGPGGSTNENMAFGLLNAAAFGSMSALGATADSAGLQSWSGTGSLLFINNVAIGTGGIAYQAGDVIAIEVDFGAKLIWFQNLTRGLGLWNGSATANPAAGAGGLSLASMNPGPYFVAVNFVSAPA